MATQKTKSGRNTTAITNPKTKSQNTDANTKGTKSKTAATKGKVEQSEKKSKTGFGRNNQAGGNIMNTGSKNKGIQGGVDALTSGSSQSWAMGSQKAGMMEVSSEFCQLKDYDIASDIVAGKKSLLKMYGSALCEIDCPNLRNLLTSQLAEVGNDQFDIFLYMNERGMYPTEQAESPKVQQAIDQYTQKSSAFNRQN